MGRVCFHVAAKFNKWSTRKSATSFSCRSVIDRENICVQPKKRDDWNKRFFYRTTDRWGCVADLIIVKMFFSYLKVNGIGLALTIPMVRWPRLVFNLIIVEPPHHYGWMELIPLVIFISSSISWYYNTVNILICKTFTNKCWFYILITIMVRPSKINCLFLVSWNFKIGSVYNLGLFLIWRNI